MGTTESSADFCLDDDVRGDTRHPDRGNPNRRPPGRRAAPRAQTPPLADTPFESDPTWTKADLVAFLRPFARVLTDHERACLAREAWIELTRAVRVLGYTGPPPRAVSPLPYLAAQLADFFIVAEPAAALGFAAPRGTVLADLLTDTEVEVLNLWAAAGSAGRPAPAPDAPPADAAETVRAWVEAGTRAAPTPPRNGKPKPPRPAVEDLTVAVGPDWVPETVRVTGAPAAVVFAGSSADRREPVAGTLTFALPEAVPMPTRVWDDTPGAPAVACFKLGPVLLSLFRSPAVRDGACAVTSVRVAADAPWPAGAVEVVLDAPDRFPPPTPGAEARTVWVPAGATPVVVVGSVSADAGRLTDRYPGTPFPAAAAARAAARVALDLAGWHDVGLPHGLVDPANVFVGADGVTTLGPPRADGLRFECDSAGRVRRVTTAAGDPVCEFEYDPPAAPRAFHFNPMGLVSAVISPDEPRVTRYTYDADGRVTHVGADSGVPAEWSVVPPRFGASGPPPAAPPAHVTADLRDLGRLLFTLLTGRPAPGRAGEPMPAAAWAPDALPPGTPADVIAVGRRCAAVAAGAGYPLAGAAAADLWAAAGRTPPPPPAAPATAPPEFAPGTTFGRYRVVKFLGRGGFGEVYLATDLLLGAVVALKLYKPGPRRAPRESWQREARLLYSLQHPHIARFEGAGKQRGRFFIATEWVRGETLAAHLAANRAGRAGVSRLAPERVADIVGQLARAVEFAHGQNVVHRDVKPQNVILTPAGEVRLIDFGLGEVVSRIGASDHWAGAGTPAYMAPEQFTASADRIGPRTDVWAIGAILYELLTGRRPFPGNTPDEVRRAVLDETVLPELPYRVRPELTTLDRGTRNRHPSLGRLAVTCLARDPDGRIKSAGVVADLIGRWRQSFDDHQRSDE